VSWGVFVGGFWPNPKPPTPFVGGFVWCWGGWGGLGGGGGVLGGVLWGVGWEGSTIFFWVPLVAFNPLYRLFVVSSSTLDCGSAGDAPGIRIVPFLR